MPASLMPCPSRLNGKTAQLSDQANGRKSGKAAKKQDMDDKSKKPATPQQSLIVNDLARNTRCYKVATCSSFSSLIAFVANIDHLCRAGVLNGV
jgi:hypothetical protein